MGLFTRLKFKIIFNCFKSVQIDFNHSYFHLHQIFNVNYFTKSYLNYFIIKFFIFHHYFYLIDFMNN